MDLIREHILGIITAAIICSVIMKLTAGNGTQSTVIKMITALFMTFSVMSPFVDLNIDDITSFVPQLYADGTSASAKGQAISTDALREGIKERAEAYILDKALGFGTAVEVTVTVSCQQIPVPESVRIEGEVSPYVKTKLSIMLENELGIPKEAQTWI